MSRLTQLLGTGFRYSYHLLVQWHNPLGLAAQQTLREVLAHPSCQAVQQAHYTVVRIPDGACTTFVTHNPTCRTIQTVLTLSPLLAAPAAPPLFHLVVERSAFVHPDSDTPLRSSQEYFPEGLNELRQHISRLFSPAPTRQPSGLPPRLERLLGKQLNLHPSFKGVEGVDCPTLRLAN